MTKLNSAMIKHALYWRYRIKLQYHYCTDEVNCADFLFITKSGYIGEIEIKVSIQDLKADFKKSKHDFIKRDVNINRHYFYFALPDYLVEKATPIIEAVNHKYGIISVNSKHLFKVQTVKKAKLLRPLDGTFYDKVKESIVMRLTSRIAGEAREFMIAHMNLAKEARDERIG